MKGCVMIHILQQIPILKHICQHYYFIYIMWSVFSKIYFVNIFSINLFLINIKMQHKNVYYLRQLLRSLPRYKIFFLDFLSMLIIKTIILIVLHLKNTLSQGVGGLFREMKILYSKENLLSPEIIFCYRNLETVKTLFEYLAMVLILNVLKSHVIMYLLFHYCFLFNVGVYIDSHKKGLKNFCYCN